MKLVVKITLGILLGSFLTTAISAGYDKYEVYSCLTDVYPSYHESDLKLIKMEAYAVCEALTESK